MSGITTLLSERVESLLPHKATAAACTSTWCSSYCDEIHGSCLWLHRYCRVCTGGLVCGSWSTGFC